MKKIISVVGFFLLVHNCTQKQINDLKQINKMENLKKFNYEPQYRLKVTSGLSYEIRVNDIPIAIRNNSGSQTIWYPINSTIIKSGMQGMEVKIFPKLTKNGLEYESFIGNDNPFEVIIEQTAWDKTGSLEEPKEVAKYTLPIKDYTNISTQKDILKFNATVPYKLLDWSDGQVFKAEDSLKLKTKVVQFYTDVKYLYENQKGKDYIDVTNKGLFNLYQSSYFDKIEADDYISHKKKFISDKKRNLEPLENYKLIICGEGKLIGLKRMDGYNNNEGVFRRIYNNDGMKEVQIDDILLYQPIGKDDLEIIWYMNYVKPADL